MNDYDEATQTVLADDGEPMSVFDIDDCPMCSGHLIHSWGDGLDQRLCLSCHFHVVRDRPAAGAGEGGGT